MPFVACPRLLEEAQQQILELTSAAWSQTKTMRGMWKGEIQGFQTSKDGADKKHQKGKWWFQKLCKAKRKLCAVAGERGFHQRQILLTPSCADCNENLAAKASRLSCEDEADEILADLDVADLGQAKTTKSHEPKWPRDIEGWKVLKSAWKLPVNGWYVYKCKYTKNSPCSAAICVQQFVHVFNVRFKAHCVQDSFMLQKHVCHIWLKETVCFAACLCYMKNKLAFATFLASNARVEQNTVFKHLLNWRGHKLSAQSLCLPKPDRPQNAVKCIYYTLYIFKLYTFYPQKMRPSTAKSHLFVSASGRNMPFSMYQCGWISGIWVSLLWWKADFDLARGAATTAKSSTSATDAEGAPKSGRASCASRAAPGASRGACATATESVDSTTSAAQGRQRQGRDQFRQWQGIQDQNA